MIHIHEQSPPLSICYLSSTVLQLLDQLNTLTKSISGSASNFLSQLSGLLVIWAGAVLVLQGKLTIGQLIAFRILSGYVTSPILRLTTMSQNFQETALSLERISDIIDNPQEIEIIGKDLPPMPPIDGKVAFENVNFNFLIQVN